MVRRAERAGARQPPALQQTRHRMQHRHFKQFFRRKRRQQPGQALRQHRLPSARRANEKNIMRACCGNLQGTLGLFLSAHITQIGDALA
jgi:hypothetical protein